MEDYEKIQIFNEKKEKVLEFIKSEDYTPMSTRHIAMFMQVPKEDRPMLDAVIDDLEKEGRIVKTNKQKIMNPEKMKMYVGQVRGNSRGFGFVQVEELTEDIFVPAFCMNGAMHRDTVLVRIVPSSKGRSCEGEIVKVIKRGMEGIVGTYERCKGYGFVIPDDKKIADDIFIEEKNSRGAVTGHKVVAKITKPADDNNKNPEGKIIEILGHADDPGVDILSIIKQFNLPVDFPDEVMKQAESVSDKIDGEEAEKREDLRSVQMVTIDGDDAKDLDDAVSVEILENGNYKLGVYIADVSYYVTENSPLDKEAFKRGTSVYLVDRVIPMLPHKLSNGICSLNAGEDRFTLCCVMEIDQKGNVINSEVKKAVINVDRRMTYNIVYDLLTNENSEYLQEYSDLMPMFKNMEKLRNILLNKRIKRGAIEFEFDEAKIVLDDKGKPVDIVKRERNVATSIIEEFMLAANETIAERFYWLELPFVYRTHEEPDAEKVEQLESVIGAMGYILKGNSNHPKSFQKMLEQAKGKPEEMLIHRMTLRSFKQARYTAENGKHFGLAATYYCHFTSPIRRYPDLQIHRIISQFISGELTEKKINKYNATLSNVAYQCSMNERKAEEAERETDKYKIVEYMRDKVGTEFDGIISGITSWGIYVELENTVEGMVSVSDLTDDSYIYDKPTMSFMGEHTHKTYTIGDKVRVMLVRASLEDRQIDFEFVDNLQK